MLLPPGLGRLGPNVIEDVLGGWGSRCRRGAGLGLWFGLGCGLRSWRTDGFRWLFGGGFGFRLCCGCGPRRGLGLGGGGVARGGDGFWGPVWEVSPAPSGGGVLDEDVVVVVDEVVVVVEVVESEAEERAVGDGGGPWASVAGVGCWVLRVARMRVRVRALGLCALFPW